MANAASVEELLKSGAHFGHLTRRWNPKMREFIFMQRNGIHIIDLNKTHTLLQESLDEITKVARSGKKILFVGTKKQAQQIIKTEAQRCDMPYVTHRWLGGMLTNFATIKKSISRMEEVHAMQTDGTYDNITKKERLMLDREKQKLENVMGGISKMGRLPGALFVIDIVKENIAVNEALKLNIPIFALVDTNCDPDIPDYIIPSNDDAAKAIQLIASNVADAIIEGMAEREAYQEEQLAAESKAKEEDEESELEDIEKSEVKAVRRRRSRKTKPATQNVLSEKKNISDKKAVQPAEKKEVVNKAELPESMEEQPTKSASNSETEKKVSKKTAKKVADQDNNKDNPDGSADESHKAKD
ncbi:MAG: 30S ribosomal protein S2 [Balneolales bacterium]